MASPDDVVRNLVLSTLANPVMTRMNFGVGGVVIATSQYAAVANAVRSGKIVVKSNPALGHMALHYHYAKPARIEATPTTSPALIVHECTHAIFDMRKLITRVEQQEAFGYLSQQLFDWLSRGGPPVTRYIVSRDESNPMSQGAWQIIFDESARLAGLLTRKLWISDDDAKHLYAAIRFANVYQDRVGKTEELDGI